MLAFLGSASAKDPRLPVRQHAHQGLPLVQLDPALHVVQKTGAISVTRIDARTRSCRRRSIARGLAHATPTVPLSCSIQIPPPLIRSRFASS